MKQLLEMPYEPNNSKRQMESILMLDFDGTMAPFSADRHTVSLYPGVNKLLHEIVERGNTRIIFVSGRPANELARMLPFKEWSEIWGEHGIERMLPDGTVQVLANEHAKELAESVEKNLIDAGLVAQIEKKSWSIAIHWRGLPTERADQVARLSGEVFHEFVEKGQARLLHFEGGLELRFSTRTKGDVVSAVIGSAMPGAKVAYLGDDITDEDAFAALKGHGLSVLVRGDLRKTQADLWIKSTKDLISFLEQWHQEEGAYI